MQLPDALTHRPLRPTDAAEVAALIAAQELHDTGEVGITEGDLVGEWQRPSYDLAASSIGVLDGERIVAYAEVMGGDRGDAAVHPEHRGRGIGTALASWLATTARAQGSSVIGMPVPQGSDGDRLLASLGWEVRWSSWVLRLPEGSTVPARPLPDGYALREATPADHRTCWALVEDAFLEWSERERTSFEDWEAEHLLRPDAEPWNLRVATDPAGEVVGVAVVRLGDGCGYVDKLATRRDQRGRGLAQALLVDAFAASAAHGARVSELATDSRTGALGLYERVGMRVVSTWVNRATAV